MATEFVKGVGQEASENMQKNEPGVWRHPQSGAQAVARTVAAADAFARVGFQRVGDAPRGTANTAILAAKAERDLAEENKKLASRIAELEQLALAQAKTKAEATPQPTAEEANPSSPESEESTTLHEDDYSRTQLNEMAASAGVEAPEKLANKAAVIAAIEEARNAS